MVWQLWLHGCSDRIYLNRNITMNVHDITILNRRMDECKQAALLHFHRCI
jgi:hypothetical protein